MYKIITIFCIVGFCAFQGQILGNPPEQGRVDHSIFNNLLQQHVRNGLVDYESWSANSAVVFQQYLSILHTTDPSKLASDNERLAFWINAYNAFTIEGVLKRYPLETIRPLRFGLVPDMRFWDEEAYTVNNKTITLNAIEHSILRKEFKEPRIHFAIVCASIGCPLLRSEAFFGDKVRDQLEEAARQFMRNPDKVMFERKSSTLHLSAIFNWFGGDFETDDRTVVDFVARYLPDINNINRKKLDIEYLDYDWNLNKQ
jgi:hypothetical protein